MMRAYVHLLTEGKDGRSPHLLADVISKLSLRHAVSVRKITTAPLRMELVVDGERIRVEEAGQEQGRTWLYAILARGAQAVRFDASRSLAVPFDFEDARGEVVRATDVHVADWIHTWPTDPTEPVERYVSRLMRTPVQVRSVDTQTYLSETAFCDAIELLLASTRW